LHCNLLDCKCQAESLLLSEEDFFGDVEKVIGLAPGDVVYYFSERKEDQSFTEPAEKGRGNGVEATREEAPVSKDMGSWKDRKALGERIKGKGKRSKDKGSRRKEQGESTEERKQKAVSRKQMV
jgi:hypothetical protein